MSAFGKSGVRCDTCGKFSRGKPTGEYVRKDSSCGYIYLEEGWIDNPRRDKDICSDCVEKKAETEQ